jgi:hypothetical protein
MKEYYARSRMPGLYRGICYLLREKGSARVGVDTCGELGFHVANHAKLDV